MVSELQPQLGSAVADTPWVQGGVLRVMSVGADTLGAMGKNIGQQAAFILLDAAVAYGVETAPGEETAMNLAVRRLNDVPGMVSVRDEGESRHVDVSPIVNGAIVSTYALAFWLAQERGVPIENIFAELRETHEGLWDE